MAPDEDEDLNKFAEEIFGSLHKPRAHRDSPQAPSGAPDAITLHEAIAAQTLVSQDVDKDAWIQERKALVNDYHLVARQPYTRGVYTTPEAVLKDILGGKIFVFRATSGMWVRLICGIGLSVLLIVVLRWVELELYHGDAPFSSLASVILLPACLLGLYLTLNVLLVVGPRGIVWRTGGISWKEVEHFEAIERWYRFSLVYVLTFYLWNGKTRRVQLNHGSDECPGTNQIMFIILVVKTVFQVATGRPLPGGFKDIVEK